MAAETTNTQAAGAEKTLLSVKDLNVSYGAIHAVQGISFDIHEGEIVTLIGANGAGKSTTLNTIAGLVKPDSGSITLDEKNLVGQRAHKIVEAGLALCPEGRRVFSRMSVAENLEMGGYTQSDSQNAKTVKMVYEHFPRLRERKNQLAGTLSGGEQQMLAMGRALMSRPKLLMLDEPSMGLAPLLIEEIFQIIRQLGDAGTTILLVEQNANMALKVADRAYVLELGKVAKHGTGQELLHDDDVRKAYLGG
ncbi:MAG: ABC transporter ATP-binding protein [Atopobium sp.]|nr:ABC transporter ATP-binding protein [Atopobium sp.]